ncbi:hypothetical protein JNB_18428 [Janibacter sp. HTCC2649]|uniref:acyl-CoA carboxylase epsilon subunit n=1 Tax=Janibacter sp. HTCC2649 TaxID=313589 RepID=UPI000067105A|nr:acyl-CoA carboxylase epsilon subunit [Janibacter sp. HTCC2649]EAP97474.1 hypothetical protein JNB_18428 [Janibacter sp. HTCC2649]
MADSNDVAAQRIEVIGDATPEQVAALVAVLSAASGGAVEVAAPRHTSQWSAPARQHRKPLTPGTRAAATWQHSLRP